MRNHNSDTDAAMSPDVHPREQALFYLDEHLRHATVLHGAKPDNIGGGGHPDKYILTLEGGVRALAKLGRDPQQHEDARREVAAVVVARTLGWGDLVPATVLRTVHPGGGSSVEAAVMVWWQDIAEDGMGPFSGDQTERAAAFDALIGHQDRGGHNWLQSPSSGGSLRLVLIDHGYSMGRQHLWTVNSFWAQQFNGQKMSDAVRDALRRFADRPKHRTLTELVGEEVVSTLVTRARRLADDGHVHDPGT